MPRKPFAFPACAALLGALALAAPAVAQQPPAPSSPTPAVDVAQPPAVTTPAPAPVEPVAPPTVPVAQVLRPGSRGASVKSLQRALRKRGITVPVDGSYGARTRAGVRVMQRRMKVRPTGVADAAVLRRLGVKVRSVAATAPRSSGGAFQEFPVPEPNDVTPSAAGFVWPANGMVSSPFGPRWGRMHEGLDIAAPEGRQIRAAKAGVVITAGEESGYGNLVVIDHGGGQTTRYGHMSAIDVAKGQAVGMGQPIGKVGSTGHSTGNHVHFEIRIDGSAVDPLPYL